MRSDVAMFIATVGLVLVSVGATMISYFLLRSQVDPEVIVYVKHDEMRPSLLMIVIQNIGRGSAYNVRFTIDRTVPAKAWGIEEPDPKEPVVPMEHGPLATGIPLLAPGEKRVLNWGQYGGLIEAVGRAPIRVSTHFESKRRFPWDPTDHTVDSLLEVLSFEATDASEPPELRRTQALERIAADFRSLGLVIRDVGTAAREITGVVQEKRAEEVAAREAKAIAEASAGQEDD